ncbi:MAG: hypothetical protein PHG20_11700 [Geobacteraceae bacterium]|nr:hypothetical protein [Geobacteraceae bacterium]
MTMHGVLFCLFFCIAGIFSPPPVLAESEVKFKVLAVNPSDTQSIKAKISQSLPPEIDPSRDLIDKAGLEVVFNPDNNVYALSGEVELKPRETKTLNVRVRDVWQITAEEVEETKQNLEAQIQGLKGTKYHDTAKLLYEKTQESIERILEEQGKSVGMKQHIELYRAHVQQLQDIKANALSLAAMRRLEDEKKQGVAEARFMIVAENPSSEPKTMSVRSVLPKEVQAEDVLEKQDFSLLFDEAKKVYILEKQDQFSANETKKYIITIRDIWRIPDDEIKFTGEQAKKLADFFRGSSFSKYAEDQGKMVQDILAGISKVQAELESSLALEDRMRAYVLNTQQMNIAKAKLRNLQQLIQEVPLKKDDASILEKIKYFVKKLADTKDVVLVAMGFKPDAPATWWLILGIIAFLGVIAVSFYFVWIKQLQKNKFAPSKEVLQAKKTSAEKADVASSASEEPKE